MFDHEKIRRFVLDLQDRSRDLEGASAQQPRDGDALVLDALREIEQALEELQVSEEELRASSESLVASQAQLEEERLRYMDLFHSAPDAYLVTDPSGTIREVNQAAATLLRTPGNRLVGKPLVVYVAEAHRRRFRRHLISAANAGPSTSLDLTLVPKRGAPIPVAMRVSARLNASGEVAELRCTLRDLTDRKRLEEQARQLETERIARREAEIANQVKTDFLATVSHELRTPLTTIIAYAELLELEVLASLPEEIRKPVRHIDEAAHHLLVLIEEILAFARVEAGRESVELERVDLEKLVREVVALLSPHAREKHLALRVGTPDQPAVIESDGGKLRQILINFVNNAIKFTAAGEIRIDVEPEGEWVAVHVQDTGAGIEEENLEKIFEPFWQVKQGPTRMAGGTGLGLAISRRFAELLGGEIQVSSVQGVGSCFTLMLPAAPPVLPEMQFSADRQGEPGHETSPSSAPGEGS